MCTRTSQGSFRTGTGRSSRTTSLTARRTKDRFVSTDWFNIRFIHWYQEQLHLQPLCQRESSISCFSVIQTVYELHDSDIVKSIYIGIFIGLSGVDAQRTPHSAMLHLLQNGHGAPGPTPRPRASVGKNTFTNLGTSLLLLSRHPPQIWSSIQLDFTYNLAID